MSRRERFTQALDSIHIPEELYIKTLDAMRQQKRRRVSFEFGRWAAIAASVAMLVIGGSFMWRYLFGDLKPDPGPAAVTPPVESSPAPTNTLETDVRPEITMIPAIECHIIKGDPPEFIMDGDGRELPRGDQTMIFRDAAELSRFIYEYNIEDGFQGAELHGISEYIDFSRKMVIAAFGFGSSSPDYLPPVAALNGMTLDVYRRTAPGDYTALDPHMRGYLLVVDRDTVGEVNYHTDGETDHDFTSDRFSYSEIPSLPNDVRVFMGREMLGQSCIYFVPDDGVVVRFLSQSTVVLPNNVIFGASFNSSVTAFSPEHMTGITATLTNSPYSLWLNEENGRFSIIVVSEKDFRYKTVGYASVDADGVWSVEWADDNVPPPEPSPSPLGDDRIQLDMSQFLINIDWPEPVAYTPQFSAFPLTSSSGYYKTHMSGPVTFVDAQLNLISLPFEPTWYAPVRSSTGVVAYSLGYDGGNNVWSSHVLMLADGTVPRGADGDYITLFDYYEHSYFVVGSLLVTVWINEEEYKYGLYDIEARRQVLPDEYDAIEPIQGELIYVRKGGSSRLLDAKGNELYTFPEGATSGIDTPYNQGFDRNYYIDTEERIFCKIPVINGQQMATIERFGDYYITRDGGGMLEHGPNLSPFYVFDAAGREVYRAWHYWYNFNSMDDYLIIASGTYFDVMDKRGNVRQFPVFLKWQILYADFIDGEVHWEELDLSLDSSQRYAVDEAGNKRGAENWQPAPTVWYGYSDGPVHYDLSTYLYSIRDANGRILLETEDFLQYYGNFVIRFRPVQNRDASEPFIIYGLDGVQLLDGMLGVIYEAPAPDGGIFVYLDERTCVLLYADGRTVPVHNAPVVEKVTYG